MKKKKKHKQHYQHKITDKNNILFDEVDYVKSCFSKVGYDNKWQAQYAVNEAKEHGAFGLSFYFCNYCGKFHLTSR